ncbi:hypothetical protein IJ750_05540 [bacterium]|nr:hypothetical protein [bacterium]
MTNPIYNPQPNYSGVTIQISNPAVNVNPSGLSGYGVQNQNAGYVSNPQICCYPPQYYAKLDDGLNKQTAPDELIADKAVGSQLSDLNVSNAQSNTNGNGTGKNSGSQYGQAYPAEYYLNDYTKNAENINKENISKSNNKTDSANEYDTLNSNNQDRLNANDINKKGEPYNSPYRSYSSDLDGIKQQEDLTTSKSIIGELSERDAAIQEEKKNTKETKIVALTDEYIKSLENYLNNPNDEIRLMASKEILTRLDEDKDRYNDAALNALLNKMLQDPAKLVRIAALSAFASQLASGNDYTVQLLNNIQSNPNADKEDVLQAADILLKMSAGVEVKRIPNPSVKDEPIEQQGQ